MLGMTFAAPIYRVKDGDEEKDYLSIQEVLGENKKVGPRKKVKDFDSLFVCEYILGHDVEDSVYHAATPYRDQWIFNKLKGRISLYQSLPFNGPYTYMQIQPDSLVKYDKQAIDGKLYAKPDTRFLVESYQVGKTVSLMMLLFGGLLGGIGILSSDQTVTDEFGRTKHEFDPSPLLGVGAGLILTSWIPYVIVKDKYSEAILKYNF